MFRKMRLRVVPAGLVTVAACLQCFAPGAQAQDNNKFPFYESSFAQSAPRGFGDRNNSWAQAMIYWKGNVYVGTSRQSICGSLYGVYLTAVGILGKPLADMFLPYPPKDPDLSCPLDPADLALQAEIWRGSSSDNWSRVFQSPATLDNPGTGAPAPPRVGKKLPYEIAFRGFAAYTEADGTEALYAFGVNSTILWDRSKLPPPRILRTTDGFNWTPVPQAPGTFLGDLPFNPDHSTYRSPVVYNGKIFALCGPVFGQGSLIASANPAQGNDAWFLAGPPGVLFYELAVFNGWLYIGGFDPTNGYAVFKTNAQGPPPYQLIPVVPPGAGLTVRPSKSVVSMHATDHLYVGTATQTEIVRINADDTWDLVVGVPRIDPVTHEAKNPISGLDAGFGHTLNDHAWRMEDDYNFMYVGTYNASTGSRFDPVFGPLLLHNMGAHLYRTLDDWYYSAVTTDGFANPADPYGGKFDFGVRTMTTTPYGLFLGTANDYYGLAIFRATKHPSPQMDSPARLEVEKTKAGSALLSWLPSHPTKSYRVFRAEILPILIRDDLNFEGWNGATGTKIPDTYVGQYSQIGATADVTFIDSTVQTGHRYMYYVAGVTPFGILSEPSNLITFPLLLPSITFAELLHDVDRWAQRQRFVASDPTGSKARQQLLNAQALAAKCLPDKALSQLNPSSASGTVLNPDSVDVEILFSKMQRRLQLLKQYPQQVQSDEYCTAP